MLLTMHYNRITLLTILILFSLLTLLHHIRPHPNIHLPGNVHNVLSYLSGSGRGSGNMISGRKITQSQVLELGVQKGVVDMGGEGEGKKGAKGGEKIPRIIHQIWINYEGGFEHVVGLREGKKENEENGKANKKERGGKSTNEEKWEVTGMEGLKSIPQEWEERRRTCRGVNRGWKVYVRFRIAFHPISSLLSLSLILPFYCPGFFSSQQLLIYAIMNPTNPFPPTS
jgi:hypothetical protein